MKKFNYFITILIFTTFSCTTVPITERKQLILFPISTERALGENTFNEILQTEKISNNKEYNELVENVGRKILVSCGLENKENWEFKVIENDVINAFALPGGKVCVYTGLLKIVDSEDELAVVIGHEIAHIVARHGSERMTQMLIAQLGGMALEKALEQEKSKTIQLAKIAYGAATQVGVLLPYSRKHEEEADYMGLVYMSKSGYDLNKALTFWEKMESMSKGQKPPEFLSTHPSHNTRINNIKKWIPEIQAKK